MTLGGWLRDWTGRPERLWQEWDALAGQVGFERLVHEFMRLPTETCENGPALRHALLGGRPC